MIWYTLVLGLMALCAFDYFWRLYKNIRLVRPINLPYVVVPFSSTSIFMIILLGTKWVLHILHRWLPDDVADVLDDTMLRTRWTVKDRVAKRLGGVYMKATSKALICSVSDASVASQIFSNRQKFPKPTQQYEVLELYGPNLVSCEGREWQHHRRHTATIFNEKNSTLVWKEAIQQTQQMIEHWREASPDTAEKGFMVEKLKADGLKLTLTILSNAGFGVPIPFKPVPQGLDKGPEGIFKDATVPPEGFDFTFRAVLAYISAHIATVILAYKVVPKWFPRQLVPVWGKQVAAYRDLDAYLNKLIAAPKAEKDNFESTANLIDGMLLSSRRAIHQGANDGGLSDIEIMGNTFIFTIAGHETTAATFSYALLLLALHQDVQEWLHRGIVEATREEPPEAADWDYTSLFPKLATPLCVMLETMRLFPPVITVPKSTGNTASSINYNGKDYVLPPNVAINVNVHVLHLSEEYWGSDAKHFHPQRWHIENKESFLAKNADIPGLVAPGLELPTIHRPIRGAYAPFSDGVRACLGKKFAQVEFVAAIAVLFRYYKVELAECGRESHQKAERVLEESISILTLGMTESVPLCVRRR